MNKTYAEDDSPPPPTLPPRNYRPSSSSISNRPLPPLPQKQPVTSFSNSTFSGNNTSVNVASSDLTQDYDCTPKADAYADQLRAQARRLSQNQPTMLNAARYQSKPLPEMKTNIIKSRPVDGQPRPQEARPLSASSNSGHSIGQTHPSQKSPPVSTPLSSSSHPLYRSSEFDRGLNFLGVNENGNHSSSDSLTSPSSRRDSQDYNMNNQRKLDTSPSDGTASQISSTHSPSPLRTQDYSGDFHKYPVQHPGPNSTPDLPPPPTPITNMDSRGSPNLDESITPPPPPPDSLDGPRSRSGSMDESTPNRYGCYKSFI